MIRRLVLVKNSQVDWKLRYIYELVASVGAARPGIRAWQFRSRIWGKVSPPRVHSRVSRVQRQLSFCPWSSFVPILSLGYLRGNGPNTENEFRISELHQPELLSRLWDTFCHAFVGLAKRYWLPVVHQTSPFRVRQNRCHRRDGTKGVCTPFHSLHVRAYRVERKAPSKSVKLTVRYVPSLENESTTKRKTKRTCFVTRRNSAGKCGEDKTRGRTTKYGTACETTKREGEGGREGSGREGVETTSMGKRTRPAGKRG